MLTSMPRYVISQQSQKEQLSEREKYLVTIRKDTTNCFMGFALVNFANLKHKLVWQTSNPRHIEQSQVNKLADHIATSGLLNKTPQHAMNCIIKPSLINPSCLEKTSSGGYKLLQLATDNEAESSLTLLSGQHRHYWLVQHHFKVEIQMQTKALETLANTKVSAAKKLEAQEALASLQEGLKSCVWLVAFYDQSKFAEQKPAMN